MYAGLTAHDVRCVNEVESVRSQRPSDAGHGRGSRSRVVVQSMVTGHAMCENGG